MKARAYILTIGTTLALIAPASQAAAAGNALGCGSHVAHAANVGTSHYSGQGSRALQAVMSSDEASTSQPLRTASGATKTTAALAQNHFQVLRNSL